MTISRVLSKSKTIIRALIRRSRILGPRRKPFQTMDRNPKYEKYAIGSYTYGRPLVSDRGEGTTLQIGRFCSIAAEVKIFLGGNHRTDWTTTYPFNVVFDEFSDISGHPSTKGDVVIGNDVWIGYGATILSGVTIGDGAVVGAYAVVSKDIAPYSIAVGNPVKTIRKRFNDDIVAALIDIKWWDWDIERIKKNIPLMLDKKVSYFIEVNQAISDKNQK